MTSLILLADYFKNAPFYRESHATARIPLKDKSDSFSPGLWFAEKAQNLEIAIKNTDFRPPGLCPPGTFKSFWETSTVEEARKAYLFSNTTIGEGDAVIDSYLPLFSQYTRAQLLARSGDESPWRSPFETGALIRYHIPRDLFRASYERDSASYIEKKFQIKFAPDDIFLKLPDGRMEQVTKHSEVFLRHGEVSIESVSPLSGRYERMICGQSLKFFVDAARELVERNPTPSDRNFDLSLSVVGGASALINGQRRINPYEEVRNLWQNAKDTFARSRMVMSPEQRGDFNTHHKDILRHYFYFEATPGL